MLKCGWLLGEQSVAKTHAHVSAVGCTVCEICYRVEFKFSGAAVLSVAYIEDSITFFIQFITLFCILSTSYSREMLILLAMSNEFIGSLLVLLVWSTTESIVLDLDISEVLEGGKVSLLTSSRNDLKDEDDASALRLSGSPC